MIFNILIIIMSVVSLPASSCYAQDKNTEESDQQINDFSLSGYGEKGKKSWDLSGKTADIFADIIKLKDVTGNLYGKDEDVKLTAQRGDFNKSDGKVHLEDRVVITTSSGSKLITDSLDWDRKNQIVTTEDIVNIHKENMVTVAKGAIGQPDLRKVTLRKDVKVDINPTDEDSSKDISVKDKTVITCDGPLEIDYGRSIAYFNNNVKVKRPDSDIYSDKMDVYFLPSKASGSGQESPEFLGSKIEKIVASGNVKVTRGQNISYSEEATYIASSKKLILTGRPKLVIYSTEEFKDASSGN